nr:immunoglobulin light chain junction region [Macaca mulatta]
CQKNYNTPYSF